MTQQTEIWVPVPGYEGLYEFSNKGRARSLDRFIVKKNNAVVFFEGVYLNHRFNKGYPYVGVSKDNIYKNLQIHILMGRLFIPNPLNLPQLNHKDGDKSNFSILNLEWVTGKENQVHSVQTGLRDNCHKLNREKVAAMNLLFSKGHSDKEISLSFNVSPVHVWTIRHGQAWSAVTGITPSFRKSKVI